MNRVEVAPCLGDLDDAGEAVQVDGGPAGLEDHKVRSDEE